jgi:hypothetical protein
MDKAGIMFCEAVARAAGDAVRKVRWFQALESLAPFVIPEGIPQNEYLRGNWASARFARKGVYRPGLLRGTASLFQNVCPKSDPLH